MRNNDDGNVIEIVAQSCGWRISSQINAFDYPINQIKH